MSSNCFLDCFGCPDSDDEWKEWQMLGDPVLHIDLRNWADVLLIAPLSAHSLAKIAHGLCDDTLTCIVRAWEFGHSGRSGKPILLAPAMNTAMWEHPLTQQQLDIVHGFFGTITPSSSSSTSTSSQQLATANHLKHVGVHVIAPQVKLLACGELGDGALASVENILQAMKYCMEQMHSQIRQLQ
jgi:phosphopantothenoylcysteine decarboxylase